MTTGSQVETGYGARPARAGRRRGPGRRGRRRQDRRSTCPRAAEGRPPAERARPGPQRPQRRRARLRRASGGPGRRAVASTSPSGTRCGRRGSRCSRTSSTLLGTFADLAELSRNQPADEERHTELRVHSSREHFHTYLQSLDVERGGLPEHFRERLRRVLRHYGVDGPRAQPRSWRRRSSGSSSPSSGRRPRWRSPPPCSAAGSPSRAPTGDLAAHARRAAGTARPCDPAALPRGRRPRPQRPVPLVRPAVRSTPSAPTCWPASATSSPRSPPTAASPTGRNGSRRWPLIPEQIVRFLAERLVDGRPRPGADAGGAGPAPLPRVRPPRPAARSRAGSTVRPAARRRRLQPRRAPDPPGLHDRHRTPSCPTPRARWRRRSAPDVAGRAAGPRRRRRPLPALARRTRGRRRDQSRSCGPLVAALPFAHDVRRLSVAVCAGAGAPGGLLRVPSRRRRRRGRGRP